MSAGAPPMPAPQTPGDLAAAWGLDDAHAQRLAWIHPFDRDRAPSGEASARLRTLAEVDGLLAASIGRERVMVWLRQPNPELFGDTPLDWMAGGGTRLAQLAMRLRAEHRARGLA